MKVHEYIRSRVRPGTLRPHGFPLALRLILSALPVIILLADEANRNPAISPLFTPMASAAAGATSLSLIAHHLLHRRLVRVLSAVSALLAITAGVQMGHFTAPLIQYWPLPGGFLWALSPLFCLIVSLSLFGASGSSRRHFWAMMNMCLGIAVCLLVLLGVVGETYEMLRWFELDGGTARILTLRGVVEGSLGAALAVGASSLRFSMRSVRRWMHVPAAVAVLFLAVLLAVLLRLEEVRDLRSAVSAKAEQATGQLEDRFRSSTYELHRMARAHTGREGARGDSARIEAWNYIQGNPELKAVVLVDTEFEIQWAVPALRYPELKRRRLEERLIPRDAYRLARFSGRPVLGSAIEIPDMGQVFVYFVPTQRNRMADGYLVGFFRIEAFVNETLRQSMAGYGAIVQDDRARVIHDIGRTDFPAGSSYLVSSKWSVAGNRWNLHVFPGRATLFDSFTIMPPLVLGLGVLLSVSFGITLFQTAFARISMRRLQREVERRTRLEAELREYQKNLEALVDERTEELEQRNRELKHLARTDALTGVFNRGRFEEEFEVMLKRAQRFGRPLTLCLLDLDHFKWINDTHGHTVGDKVLQQICRICRPNLREADVFARYGGEEFVLLMDEADLETAVRVVERMRSTLENTPIVLDDGVHLSVTASFGLASLTPEIESRKQLLSRADQALYNAKANGRNRVETWKPEYAGSSAPRHRY